MDPSRSCPWIFCVFIVFLLKQCDSCVLKQARPSVSNSETTDSVNVYEYELMFEDLSSDFWKNVSGLYWYKPTRLYKCQSQATERFLLLFHYYYGLFKPFINVGLLPKEVSVTAEPNGCLFQKTRQEIEVLFQMFILNNLNPVNESTSVVDLESSVCTMKILDDSGWGKIGYNCCRISSAGVTNCNQVADDAWVWILRAIILFSSIVLFLYFPLLIPKGYRKEMFSFHPPSPQIVNIMTTRNQQLQTISNMPLIVPLRECYKMKEFCKTMTDLPTNSVFSMDVTRADFKVSFDRIIADTEEPFSITRALFDSFLQCKIRHSDPLEDCCTSRACGQCSHRACPSWIQIFITLRTIMIFAVMALPAVPFLYHLCAPGLEYRQLMQMMDTLSLRQTYSFNIGTSAGTVAVALIATTYVTHVIVVVVDGIMDKNLSELYSQLLSSKRAKSSLNNSKNTMEGLTRKAVLPLKRFGIIVLPLWLIGVLLSPLVIMLYFVITSPVLQIAKRVLYLMRDSCKGASPRDENKFNVLENLLFSITLFSVLVVLTIGCNLILHGLAMVIVNMIINIKFTMRILPVILLVVFYIRDSFSNVSATYSSHHHAILGLLMQQKDAELQETAKQSLDHQENIIFQVCGAKERFSSSFLRKNGELRMRTKSLLLFLHEDDIPYQSRKFFDLTTELCCHGSPGKVSNAIIGATWDFLRILIFLVCLLVVVMAYGDISYISPEGQFFATFVTGLIPFALKKFFLKTDSSGSLHTGNLRFKSQFESMKDSFQQTWPLDDLILERSTETIKPEVVSSNGSGVATSQWKMQPVLKQEKANDRVDLIIDVSDFPVGNGVLKDRSYSLEEKKAVPMCPKLPCLNPASVSP